MLYLKTKKNKMESNMAKKTTTPTSNLSADKAKAVEAAIALIE